jgi:hypothetical protein
MRKKEKNSQIEGMGESRNSGIGNCECARFEVGGLRLKNKGF